MSISIETNAIKPTQRSPKALQSVDSRKRGCIPGWSFKSSSYKISDDVFVYSIAHVPSFCNFAPSGTGRRIRQRQIAQSMPERGPAEIAVHIQSPR